MAPREQPFSASSTALSHLVVIGLLLMGFLPLIPRPPWVATMVTPLPVNFGQPHEVAAPASEDSWTDGEIVHGREECMHLLQSVAADVDMLAPIKRADCGLPAPVRLKSLGLDSKVVFEPPVEINCRMMAALYRWNKTTLQPAARNKLGSSVARIVGASGYACRNVYNLPDGNLSQHAFANAIDIAAFGLKDGRSVTVLKGWGPTARDIRAQTKAKLEPVRSKSPAAAGKGYMAATSFQPASAQGLARASSPISLEGGAGALKPTLATKFLNSLHEGACREFETILGPEANEAHRTHFHFDLNAHRSHAVCE